MIVVDATVVSFLFIEGEMTQSAKELFQRDAEWVTPPILNHEMLSILAVIGSADQVVEPLEEVWRQIRSLIGARQQVPDPLLALRIAIELKISGVHGQYLALAEQLNLPLVTEDIKLRELAPHRCFSIDQALNRLT